MDDLGALALDAAVGLTTAELHGAVCGLLAADAEGFDLDALIELVGEDALADQETVRRFVAGTVPELFAEDMSFEPLLPGDDEPFEARIAGLAQWCGAFASGYVAAAGELPDGEESDVAEILRDFVAISQLEERADDDEDGERDLVELIEFVRVGTLLLVGSMRTPSEEDDDV